jgi:hypothetical protein
MTNQAHAAINGDCNPACIVADLLLNPRAGLACDPDVDVNTATLDAFAEQCVLENVGLSPLITRGEELRSQLTSLLEVVDAGIGLDADGRLALVMNRVSNAPVAIGDAQLAALPNFKPADWSSVINETRLTFIDRDSGWQPDFVEWKDNAGIYAKDRPEPQTLDRQMVTHRDLALLLVSIAGPVAALPACDGTLQLAFDAGLFSSLVPGAAIAFTTSLRPVMNGIYRITSRTWPDPAKPIFEVEVSIDRSYLYTLALDSGGRVSNIDNPPPAPDPAPVPADYSRFALVELPVGLCPNNQPAIAALVARDTQGTVSAQLFLGRNFVFTGDPPDSFFLLKTITRFAFHGALPADFAAATAFTSIANALPAEATGAPFPLTDGLALLLDGPDILLPNVSDFDALANALLLFVGNEIMSIADAELTYSGAYTLTVIRGRFGTAIADHLTGDTVLIIPLADLLPLQHPHFLGGNTGRFKLTLGGQDASDVDAFDQVFAGTNWNFPVYLQQLPNP